MRVGKDRHNQDTEPFEGEADDKALADLAAAWDVSIEPELYVVGRLRSRPNHATAGFSTFLEDLVHPDTGRPLIYPAPAPAGPAHVFVPPREAERIAGTQDGSVDDGWMLAALELSPRKRREERRNPFACTVRPGTLRRLSTVPEMWNVTVTGVARGHLILEAAREAIEARLAEETSASRAALGRAELELAGAVRERDTVGREVESAKRRIADQERRLAELTEDAERKVAEMEERARRLAGFVEERGRRLRDIGLIDEDDLRAVLPEAVPAVTRVGHPFTEALNGDFTRVAGFVQTYLWRRDVLYGRAQIQDFLAVLRTHDLIVLAGDSGSGKTNLVRSVAEAIGGRCRVIPVKPNWTGSEDLLGYYNPIEGRYHPTPFLEALVEASREPDVPHLICLDEMNLARVEHYFADFLSLLEARREPPEIPLYAADEQRHAVADGRIFLAIEAEARRRASLPEDASLEDLLFDAEANEALHRLSGLSGADTILAHHARLRRAMAGLIATPTSLTFPTNVRIVGTVNIDDTTHYLSPKILDRAHVLRFRNPLLTSFERIEAEVEEQALDLDLPLQISADDLGGRNEYPPFDRADADLILLAGLARDHLDPLGVEFGLRAVRQSAHYLREARTAGIGRLAALNNVVLHKVLPKITLDIERPGVGGRSRRDGLLGLREALAVAFGDLDPSEVTEACVPALDRMIAAAEANNGIVSYWTRP